MLITVIICVYITKKFAAEQVQWNLIVKKATNWVKKEAEQKKITVDLASMAQKFLSTKGL
jgi:hypothetical protein